MVECKSCFDVVYLISEMDYEYNQFMLRITREILESDIENDDQIERILLSHVARSKQQLREVNTHSIDCMFAETFIMSYRM